MPSISHMFCHNLIPLIHLHDIISLPDGTEYALVDVAMSQHSVQSGEEVPVTLTIEAGIIGTGTIVPPIPGEGLLVEGTLTQPDTDTDSKLLEHAPPPPRNPE